MPQLRVTELEFEQIKSNLKEFMRGQEEFSDYDFDGAGLNVLLDVLAYNTHYNGILAHMLANEAFLDSAIKRQSVVSIARAIGYSPNSNTGSVVYGNLTIYPSAEYVSNSLIIDKNVVFNSTTNSGSLSFCVDGSFSATRTSLLINEEAVNTAIDRFGVNQVQVLPIYRDAFVFENVKLKQGSRVTNTFVVDNNSTRGPFTIPNENVDTSTLIVRVQNSRTDLTLTTYLPYTNIIDVDGTTNVFFVNEQFDGLHSISFGDGVIGNSLEAGNLVIVEYLVSDGLSGNSLTNFSCKSSVTGPAETVQWSTTVKSAGGRGKESIDSIRFNAPLYNATKGRVVTASDYETLIKQNYGNVNSVTVWGGEKNDPPEYGKVFISAQPVAGSIITEAQKLEIINNVILPRSPVSVIPQFVDPEITYIFIDGKITYDAKKTFLTESDIENAGKNAIRDYFNTELNVLGRDFYFSKAHDYVKNTSTSIISVSIDNGLQKRVMPVYNIKTKYYLKYNAKIHPRDITSTYFLANVDGAQFKVTLSDVPREGVQPPAYSGFGDLYLTSTTGVRVSRVGTINYDTGEAEFDANISQLYGSDLSLKISAYLHDDAKDVSTEILTRTTVSATTGAVFVKPSTNTIFQLDDSVYSAVTGSRNGLDFKIVAKR